MTHSASSVQIKFSSNIAGVNKFWGIRDFNVTVEKCSDNCLQCLNAYKCTVCAPNYVIGSDYSCRTTCNLGTALFYAYTSFCKEFEDRNLQNFYFENKYFGVFWANNFGPWSKHFLDT